MLLLILAVGLILIEIEIFAIAVMKSGHSSRLQILGDSDNVIYETDGDNLSEFKKHYFEKTFGPLENYQVRLQSQKRNFPFRAWLAAAVGIPIGAILLFGFVIQAVATLLYGEGRKEAAVESDSQMERLLDRISRYNIFALGVMVVVVLLSIWLLPNAIAYMGKKGIETFIRFRWLLISAGGVFTGVVVWIIYLRYLLAKKTIENRTEMEKFRLELEYRDGTTRPARLAYTPEETDDVKLVGVEEELDR